MLDMHTQALGLPPLLWDAQPLPLPDGRCRRSAGAGALVRADARRDRYGVLLLGGDGQVQRL